EFGRLVKRKEKGMAEALVIDQSTAKDAASPVGFGEAHLGYRTRHIDHGNHGNPAKSPSSFVTDIDEPLVVASTNSYLHFRFVSQWTEKQRWIENLNVDIELVHMREAAVDIAHLSNIFRQTPIDINAAIKNPPVD